MRPYDNDQPQSGQDDQGDAGIADQSFARRPWDDLGRGKRAIGSIDPVVRGRHSVGAPGNRSCRRIPGRTSAVGRQRDRRDHTRCVRIHGLTRRSPREPARDIHPDRAIHDVARTIERPRPARPIRPIPATGRSDTDLHRQPDQNDGQDGRHDDGDRFETHGYPEWTGRFRAPVRMLAPERRTAETGRRLRYRCSAEAGTRTPPLRARRADRSRHASAGTTRARRPRRSPGTRRAA